MLNCDHRGLQWHGHLHRGLHGGILRHRKRGDNYNNIRLISQHSSWTQGRTQAQGNLLLRHESDSEDLFFCDHSSTWRSESDNPNGGVHRYTLSRALCQRSSSQTDRWRTPYTSALLRFKVGLKSHFIKSSDADLLHLSATVTTSTTTNWHFCSCVASAQGLVPLVWQFDVTPNKHRLWAQTSPQTPTSLSALRTVRWMRAEQGLF